MGRRYRPHAESKAGPVADAATGPGRTPWKVVSWKVMVNGLPSCVKRLPSALQLKIASSVSKLQATRNQRWLGGVPGLTVTRCTAGAAAAAPVLSHIWSFKPPGVFTTPIQA